MSVTYRSARKSDAKACASIVQVWGAETPWMVPLDDLDAMAAFWADLLELDTAWVAEMDGAVVGFCVREEANIDGLYVAAHARNQGVGKALLDLAKADRDRLEIWVYEKNEHAHAFYKREGCKDVSRELDEHEGSDLMYVGCEWVRP
ncbi:MAG: GNAT family N-acetyltransferase [Pseudomonadota bacterium]